MPAAAIEENSSRKDGDCFIPQSFAQEKLKTASSKYIELKTNYDMHILQLQQSHDSHCLTTKLFYEEYIRDMKFKAKSHISGQMILHSDLVNDMKLQVTNSVLDVERLRDQLSDSRLNHQKESRSLKCLLSSAKENRRLLELQRFDSCVRYECEGAMAEMISITELNAALIKQESNMLVILERLSSLLPPPSRGVGVTEVKRSQRSLRTAGGQQVSHPNTLVMIDELGTEISRIVEENTATRGIVCKCIELERAILTQSAKYPPHNLTSGNGAPNRVDRVSSGSTSEAAMAEEVLERGMRELSFLCSVHDEESSTFSVTLARQSENILKLEVEACMLLLLGRVEIESAHTMQLPLSGYLSGAAGRGHSDGNGLSDGAVHRCAWCLNRRESEPQDIEVAAISSRAVAEARDYCNSNSNRTEEHAQGSSRACSVLKASHSVKSHDTPDPTEQEWEELEGEEKEQEKVEKEVMSKDLVEQPYRESTGSDLHVSLSVADGATIVIGEDISAVHATPDAILDAPADSKGEGEKVIEMEMEKGRSSVTEEVVRLHSDEHALQVEQLEDFVYELQQSLSAASKLLEEGQRERCALSETLSAILKEKRTDIVGEYVAEIQALREREEGMRESLVSLRASRSKDEMCVLAI